jgi:hypothetical protein
MLRSFSTRLVSSLRDLVPILGGLPRTYVLGYRMPPLRGWSRALRLMMDVL